MNVQIKQQSWSVYAFYLFNKDCQNAAHTISIITLTVCLFGIWFPVKHAHGLVTIKLDELLNTTTLALMAIFYLSTACCLYYASLNQISELYVPFIVVHSGKILYDCFDIVRNLSQTLYYLRLSLRTRSISALIFFPTKLEWNYQSTAYERFRIIGFILIEVLIRAYAVCIVWHAYVQLDRELQPTNKASTDIENGSLTENQLVEESDDPRLTVHTVFINRKPLEKF